MRIVLVNPTNEFMYPGAQPTGLTILAAYLRQFYPNIKILDRVAGDNLLDLSVIKPDIVGVTGTTPTSEDCYNCADYAKSLGCKVVIGGVHASIRPKEALEHADAVVVGEGEKAFKKIIDENLTGIIKGEIINDLDEIPIPAYDLVHMEFYFKQTPLLKIVGKRIANILTSRGCPYNCTFCHNSFKNLKYRANSPERTVKEIEYLIEKYQVNAIFFIEDNFFVNKERVINISKLLIEKRINIVWGANSRVNNIDIKTLKIAKNAGCYQITFGWESGSQRMLDIYNKQVTVKQNEDSIKLCREAGIKANGTVMIGGPGETLEDLNKTRKFITENDIDGGVGVCITTPLPGTKMWEDLKEKPDVDFSQLNFFRTPIPLCDFSEEELRLIQKKFIKMGYFKDLEIKNRDEMEAITI